MGFKSKNIFTSFLFLLGGILVLISEYTPWVSNQFSPWDFLTIRPILVENFYMYTFPLITSLIVIVIGIAVLFLENRYKFRISIFIFIAISFQIIFLLEMFSEHGSFLLDNSGVFYGIIGFSIIFFGLLYLFIQDSAETSPKPLFNEEIAKEASGNTIKPDEQVE